MQVFLLEQSIESVEAEALLMPVDGDVCLLGSAAMKGLKSSLKKHYYQDDWLEMLEYLEEDVRRLAPIPQGKARIIEGDGDFEWLVIAACQPHHVNDVIIPQSVFCNLTTSSLVDGIRQCVQQGIKSLALTLISTSYRITADQSMRAIVEALVVCRAEPITIHWAFRGKPGQEDQKRILADSAMLLSARGVDCQTFMA